MSNIKISETQGNGRAASETMPQTATRRPCQKVSSSREAEQILKWHLREYPLSDEGKVRVMVAGYLSLCLHPVLKEAEVLTNPKWPRETLKSFCLVSLALQAFSFCVSQPLHFQCPGFFPAKDCLTTQKNFYSESPLNDFVSHFSWWLIPSSSVVIHCIAHISHQTNGILLTFTLKFELLFFYPGLSENPRPGPVSECSFFIPVLGGQAPRMRVTQAQCK